MSQTSDVSAGTPPSPVPAAFAALEQGDIARFVSAIADSASWHVTGRGPFAGEHIGRAGIAQLFTARLARSRESYHVKVLDIHAGTQHVVVLHSTHTRLPRDHTSLGVTVLHALGGSIAEAWEYTFDTRASDDFWSSAGPDDPLEGSTKASR